MNMHSAGLAFSLLTLAACVGPAGPSARLFPLVAGGGTRSPIRRADIDERRPGPPPLDFEVECSPLPYAQGEERAFCHEFGSWAVLRLDRGILVACACGEFGGFLSWYGLDGNLRQVLIAGDVPLCLISDGESLLCVTGLSHLSVSRGAIEAFVLEGVYWRAAGATPLLRQAESVEVEADGGLRLRLRFDGGEFRYRAGTLERRGTS